MDEDLLEAGFCERGKGVGSRSIALAPAMQRFKTNRRARAG